MAVSVSNTANSNILNFASSPQTFTSVSFGAAASDRLIFVSAEYYSVTAVITAMTIGGVSATKDTGSYATDGSNGSLGWWWALVPTGTTGNIVVTSSSPPADTVAISVYRVVGANTTTPVSSSTISSGTNITLTVPTSPANGAMIVASDAWGFSAAPALSGWTGVTSDGGGTWSNINSFANGNLQVASTTSTGSITATATFTGTVTVQVTSGIALLASPEAATAFQQGAFQSDAFQIFGGVIAGGGTAYNQIIAVLQGETINLVRNVGKINAVTQGEVVRLVRNIGKIIQVTSGETVNLVRGVVKLIAMTLSETVLLTARHASNTLITITQSELVNLVATKVTGAHFLTIAVLQGEAVNLARSVGKVISVTQAQTVKLVRAMGKIIAVLQGETVNLVRKIGKTIAVTTAQLVALSERKALNKLIAVLQSELVNVVATKFVPSHSQVIAVLSGETVKLGRKTGKIIAILQGQFVLIMARGQTPGQTLETLKNIIVRSRSVNNAMRRVRALKNIITGL